jgi:hypothetical protein
MRTLMLNVPKHNGVSTLYYTEFVNMGPNVPLPFICEKPTRSL